MATETTVTTKPRVRLYEKKKAVKARPHYFVLWSNSDRWYQKNIRNLCHQIRGKCMELGISASDLAELCGKVKIAGEKVRGSYPTYGTIVRIFDTAATGVRYFPQDFVLRKLFYVLDLDFDQGMVDCQEIEEVKKNGQKKASRSR